MGAEKSKSAQDFDGFVTVCDDAFAAKFQCRHHRLLNSCRFDFCLIYNPNSANGNRLAKIERHSIY